MSRLGKLSTVTGVTAAGLVVAGVAYAATLTLNPGTVTANQAAISGCMTGTATLTYGTPTDTGSGFTVPSVTVGGIDSSAGRCVAGMKVYLNLTDGAATPTIVATGTAVSALAGTSATNSSVINLNWATGKSLKDVGGVNIAIQ